MASMLGSHTIGGLKIIDRLSNSCETDFASSIKSDTAGKVNFYRDENADLPVFQAYAEGTLCVYRTSPAVSKVPMSRMALS
jgi:hypothetical protein